MINSAGLEADTIAGLAGIDVDAAGYRLHYCKGSYFSASSRCSRLVSRLVYPVPAADSLGVHVVLDVGGRLRFGPDAEYLPDRRLDYRVDPGRRAAFAEAARRLLPEIGDEDLEPDISGIRPKLQAKGAPARDFVIAEESARGLPGFVESPRDRIPRPDRGARDRRLRGDTAARLSRGLGRDLSSCRSRARPP